MKNSYGQQNNFPKPISKRLLKNFELNFNQRKTRGKEERE